MSAKKRRRLSDVELAATIGKAVADALEPRFARIENTLVGIRGSIDEMRGSIDELRGSVNDIRAVAIERHLDLDQRVRRIEQHLKLPD